MPNNKKRGDNVASSRSRLENEKVAIKEQSEAGTRVRKTGRYAQEEFTEMITKMFKSTNAQIEVEPTLPIKIETDEDTGAFSDFAQFLEKEINKKKLN